jgi:hypothetical protein
MPYIDVDIDVSEFFNSMSNSEKREMLNMLKDYFRLNNANTEEMREMQRTTSYENHNLNDLFFLKEIQNIYNNRLRLSKEDEELISKISNKY